MPFLTFYTLFFLFVSTFLCAQPAPKQAQWSKLYIVPDKRNITRGDEWAIADIGLRTMIAHRGFEIGDVEHVAFQLRQLGVGNAGVCREIAPVRHVVRRRDARGLPAPPLPG